MAILDGKFEGEQVARTRSFGGNAHIRRHAQGFLIVQRKMLDRGNHMAALDAGNDCAIEPTGQ